MKTIGYLETPEAPMEFIREILFSEGFRKMFPCVPFETKRSLILNFLIGPETWRYAAEPVYGPTGKGFLRSKGVEGLLAEKRLEAELASDSGRAVVLQFVQKVEALLAL